MKRTREIENSLICVNRNGAVGIVAAITAGGAIFYPFDKNGGTEEGSLVAIGDLKQADASQIPASRMLPDAQLIELGYLDDPDLKQTPPALPAAIE